MRAGKIKRRDFIRTAVGAAAVGSLPGPSAAAATPESDGKIIAIQVGSISFVDEGVEQVLDILQERARVNALWLAGFTYGRGIAGRQVPGQPLPDHGKLEYDLGFRGGSFSALHSQYYRDTGVDPAALRAPDHGDWDFFGAVLPAARKRGIRCVTWIEDVFRSDIPGIEKLQCVDLNGNNTGRLCHNNPYHRNLLLGLTEDYLRSYDLDGIMYGSERQGAFSNSLGASHGGGGQDPNRVECFCRYCEEKAKKQGIHFGRAKNAFLELARLVQAGRARRRPADGYHVALWRLMLRYPELLAWEHLFHSSLREIYRAMSEKVKSVKPGAWFGLHIWHNNSFNPIYRAEQDLSELTQYTDFLKMVMYHNAGGPRIAGYIDSVSQTIFGEVPRDELLQFHYRVMGYNEAPYEKVRTDGLKRDYVYRESRRAVDAARGSKTLILPGIDIDIPTGVDESRSTPEDVRTAVVQAFQAGVDGIILSRKYSEMRLANLSGAGAGVKELRLA